ncbi:MAG TPA: LuxR C-terminal-related transcriptional regulator [Baekduia sp.]|nr:LuxR C-terminal-related transcriptional regulator [Baekduia sp.]
MIPRVVTGLVPRPRLFALLDRGADGPVTLISAPAGSGKTMLLASWLNGAPPSTAVAWVAVERDETDATRLWAAVIEALRTAGAIAPDDPLATLTPAPLGGNDEFVRRLVDGLGRLTQPVYLILDDVHHLRSEEALHSLEELLASAPAQLRTFILTRRDPKLGLHRLRVAGELTEVRAADLEFTSHEMGELMAAAGVDVPAPELARVHERTEGWAAGLRLAAMSLARHDDPARFIAEFSGSERTVADYLVGEVLASQPSEVRGLLLRTCVLERVNGPLADLLTGRTDGARLLLELEEANALVVTLDVGRTWFRYHHLLADLLRLELRREAPDDVARLHRLAAAWHAQHGDDVEAIRHAALGADWELATELLGRSWVRLLLDGEEATLGALMALLPDGHAAGDAELATILAADRMAQARWDEADTLLDVAGDALAAVPPARRARAETALATTRLIRARRLGDMDAIVEVADAPAPGASGSELEALALMNLGIAETWIRRDAEAEAHLERGLALGRAAGRTYVIVGCLGGLGSVANITQRLDLAEQHLQEAVGVAERAGWSAHPIAAAPTLSLAAVHVERGRLDAATELLARAELILADFPEPPASVALAHIQGMLAMSEGRFADARSHFRAGQRRAANLRAEHFLLGILRQWELRAALRLGDLDAVRAALPSADPGAQTSILEAHVSLAEGDPEGAAEAVGRVFADPASIFHINVEIEARLLDGLGRAALGDGDGAYASVERALELSERDGRGWIMATVAGARELLEAHPVHRTAHGAHLRATLDQLAGTEPAAVPAELAEPLSERELAVLRFLPTNLSASEIGGELFLSVHTVKTHMRKLYAKLDVHTRAEAVQRGRELGLLAQRLR